MEILIATGNQGKIKELRELLAILPIELKTLNDFQNIVEIEETGETFAENAILKAKGYALQTNMWALADDSGLEIDALNGEPGVFSARYAGENASSEERNAKVLAKLENNLNRNAKFVCSIAISDEKGEIKHLTDGVCQGKIILSPRGTNGFGYDPIFVPDDFDKTFGEIADKEKQEISHRGKAMKKIFEFLQFLT